MALNCRRLIDNKDYQLTHVNTTYSLLTLIKTELVIGHTGDLFLRPGPSQKACVTHNCFIEI